MFNEQAQFIFQTVNQPVVLPNYLYKLVSPIGFLHFKLGLNADLRFRGAPFKLINQTKNILYIANNLHLPGKETSLQLVAGNRIRVIAVN